MSTLPPDAHNAPAPEDNEPDDSAVLPRWAVPAVPPPWAGTEQAVPGSPVKPAQTPEQAAPATPEPAATPEAVQAPALAGPPPWSQPAPAQPAPSGPPAWAQPTAAPAQPSGPPAPAQPAPTPQPYGQPSPAPQPYGQPAYGQPAYGQPAYGQSVWAQPGAAPATARKPLFDQRRLWPTVAVAGIVVGVVLGGMGLDRAIAAPSAGKVDVGNAVTITAAPGWVRADNGLSGTGVTLQKANAQLMVEAEPYTNSASAALGEVEQSISSANEQISYGQEQDGTLSGRESAMVGFEAIISGPSGSGTVDGELICVKAGGDVVVFEVVTSQGDLGGFADDVKSMVSSIEVGQ